MTVSDIKFTRNPLKSLLSSDTEPPMIDKCRSPPTVEATGSETAVVWEEPQFSDNSGIRPEQSYEEEQFLVYALLRRP